MIRYNLDGWFPTLALLWGRSSLPGSIIPAGLLVALPSGIAAIILMHLGDDFNSFAGTDTLKSSQLWAALAASLTFMISFRTNKAYARFWDGTTLLHQMWGEWFDAVSCLVAFSSIAKHSKGEEVQKFRHTLVRLMSLCHGSALEEIGVEIREEEGYPCIDTGGLDQTALRYLKECKFNPELNFNRVEVIIHMIQTLIVTANEAGVLKVPPPILSRVFQTISRGQVNLANCKKITHTLFPFPYAQIIAGLLVVFSIATPCIMASIMESWLWAFICSTLPCFALWSLNYVAGQLEIPFGDDSNDLPLTEFQEHMNTSMLMLIRDESDIVPTVTSRCAVDFATMKANISNKKPKHFVLEDESAPVAEAKDLMLGPPSLPHEQKVFAPSPTPAAPPPATTAAPPAASPPAMPAAEPMHAEHKAMADMRSGIVGLEQALQLRMSELCSRLEDMSANAGIFSSTLAGGTSSVQGFTKITYQVSSQMTQTSGSIAELNTSCIAAAKQWEIPKLSNMPGAPGNAGGNPQNTQGSRSAMMPNLMSHCSTLQKGACSNQGFSNQTQTVVSGS